ncbi:MAG: YqgE/AlgH family protein [Acidobacteria bacterium]|nr:YqgE/AlgH family protein [Acidobacteriota bacterium]
MTEAFRPALLLSMPQLQDPNFARTVVLLCEFNPDGAFGVVLNRPTDMAASDMVRLDPPVAQGNDLALYIGGPVEPQRGWILVSEAPDVEFKTIRDGLYLSTSPTLLRQVLEQQPAPRARVLAGYAGWGPGQLDEELAQSAWLMTDIELDLVFDVSPSAMWEIAIRRLGADPSTLTMGHGVH